MDGAIYVGKVAPIGSTLKVGEGGACVKSIDRSVLATISWRALTPKFNTRGESE